jgi:Skp family chaperone for outer membrane proteins
MRPNVLRPAAIALIAALALPQLAAAQAAAPTPANGLGGVVPGVCMLSQQGVLTNAQVGKAATARLQVLAQQAQAEVSADKSALDADIRAFQAGRAAMKPADATAKQNALAARERALQQKAAVRNREIEITREKALARIATEAQPLIAQVYKARGCGMLMDRTSVLGGNSANDITIGVIAALDAKMTTITFDRETLAQPAAH